MTSLRRILLAASLAMPLAAQAPPRSVAHPAAQPAAFTIAGVVTDSVSGAPVPRASVTLLTELHTDVVATTQTADDGSFSFSGIAAGRYPLRVSRRGYHTSLFHEHDQYSSAIVTGPDQDTAHIDFRIAPDAMLRGYILDESGEPVPNARAVVVRRSRASGLGQRLLPVAQGNSDDQGLFELWNLPPGDYFVAAVGTPWYATHLSTQNAKLTAAQQAASAPLDVAYPVTYYDGVTDESAAAPVHLAAGDHPQINLTLQAVPALHARVAVPADQQGRFFLSPTQTVFGQTMPSNASVSPPRDDGADAIEIAGLAPGHYTLLDPATRRTIALEASGSGTLEVNAAAAPAALHLDLTVRMADGSAPAGVSLALISADSDHEAIQGRGEKPGHFRFEPVPPGDWYLSAYTEKAPLGVVALESSSGSHPGSRISFKDRSLARVAVLAPAASRVSGIALKDGKPDPGAMVILVPSDPESAWPLFRRDQADSDGTFNLLNVAPGRYSVVAIDDAWDLDWARPEVLARYLPRAQSVLLTSGSAQSVRLPAPVPVQAAGQNFMEQGERR